MTTHPYISGPGNVEQMIAFLRKNFPSTVSSETVKKFSIASNNESYVINALQFIGVLDGEGKRTSRGHDIFVLPDDKFPEAFGGLVRDSYKDLFELRGNDAWTLSTSELTAYFRTSDKTSEVIGGRQAGLFRTFARLSGHEGNPPSGSGSAIPKAKAGKAKATVQKLPRSVKIPAVDLNAPDTTPTGRREVAMTVRIEINLPANGTKETYDNIFKSIRANLIDD